jgi:hypothetical protein
MVDKLFAKNEKVHEGLRLATRGAIMTNLDDQLTDLR